MGAISPIGGVVPSTVFVFVVIWAVILVHELGHYYAGRRIVGIPSEEIKLVAPYFPRYVALRDDEEWVTPETLERYRAAYARHDPDREHERRFAAAGELIQAAVVAPVGVVAALLVSVDVGVTILIASLLLSAVYVLIDAGASLYRGRPSGDYSLLWESTPGLPFVLWVGFASVHVVALAVVT